MSAIDAFIVNEGSSTIDSVILNEGASDYMVLNEDVSDSNVDDESYITSRFLIGIEKVSVPGMKYWLPNVEECKKPAFGMVFESFSDASSFYKRYAKVGGFEAIRSSAKGNTIISLDSSLLPKYQTFICARGGSKGNEKPVDTLNTGCSSNSEVKNYRKRNKASKKTGCVAKIRLSRLDDNKYMVYRFIEEHNHPLVHPDYRIHLNSNRELNFSNKRLLHKMGEASVGAYSGHRILTKVAGSQDVGFSKTDAKNYKRDVIAYIGKYDCQMVVNLLNKKKQSLRDFSFDYFVDEDSSLGGMFWADEVSKMYFYAFGDVVSFDATYRTNKYDMVFIPFTGVDNHKRCVTFGAGMLGKENVSSYKWLLNAFKKAFPNVPSLLLTDQDPAMKIAIESMFPVSRHR